MILSTSWWNFVFWGALSLLLFLMFDMVHNDTHIYNLSIVVINDEM